MNVLQAAMQPEVVEVRMQFADWLLRSGFPISDALEQLGAASDLLLEIEEGSEDEEEDEAGADARYYSGLADRGDNDSDDGGSSVAPSDWDRSQSNFGSKKGSRAGSRMGSSRAGSMAGSRASRKSGSKAGSKAGSQSSRMSKRKKSSSKKKLGRVKLWICLNWDIAKLENLEFPNSKHNPNLNNERIFTCNHYSCNFTVSHLPFNKITVVESLFDSKERQCQP